MSDDITVDNIQLKIESCRNDNGRLTYSTQVTINNDTMPFVYSLPENEARTIIEAEGSIKPHLAGAALEYFSKSTPHED